MRQHLVTTLAIAAAGFLTACGGGDMGDTVPEAPETALFDAEEASRLQVLANAGPPEETTAEGLAQRIERLARRENQGRTGSGILWLDSDRTDDRYDTLRDLALDHWEDVEWHGILSKNGVTLYGSRSGGDRALGVDMDHVDFSVFTTNALGGGYATRERTDNSGSAPSASASWLGLMIGAAHNGGHLLLGDATVAYDFDARNVDVSITDIVNFDRMAVHSVPKVSFQDIPVHSNGGWRRGEFGDPEYIVGGFGGEGQAEAAARFQTPDMTGSFGARRQ